MVVDVLEAASLSPPTLSNQGQAYEKEGAEVGVGQAKWPTCSFGPVAFLALHPKLILHSSIAQQVFCVLSFDGGTKEH